MKNGHRHIFGWAVAMLWVVGCTVALFLVFKKAYLGYDSAYALLWGDDLASGRLPDYRTLMAPTPHPLTIAVAALMSLLGTASIKILLVAGMVSLSLLGLALYRLGTKLYSIPVGTLAALVVVSRGMLDSVAVREFIDIPFLALVVAAAAMEATRSRRGVPVLVTLALAGLIRPEGWLLSAAYYLYLALPLDWGNRIKLMPLAVAGPIIWSLSDLAITGNPLHSLTSTQSYADLYNRYRTVEALPKVISPSLNYILGAPVLIGGAVGCVFSLRHFPRHSIIPVAILAIGVAVNIMLPLAHLPLIVRYLLLPAVVFCLFYSLAIFGWLMLPNGFERWAWAAVAIVLALFTAVSVPEEIDKQMFNLRFVENRGRIQANLEDAARFIEGSGGLRQCAPIYVPNHRPVPILAHALDRPTSAIESMLLKVPKRGIIVYPATSWVAGWYLLDPKDPKKVEPAVPSSFKRQYRNRSWIVLANC